MGWNLRPRVQTTDVRHDYPLSLGIAHVASLFVLAILGVPTSIMSQAPPNAPVARVVPKVDTLHGEKRVDNYFWLRDKGSPEVCAYLEAENAYTEAGMTDTQALQETLYKELLGRVKESDMAAPYRQAGYWYYTRMEKGKSYPIYCRKRARSRRPKRSSLIRTSWRGTRSSMRSAAST